MQSRIQTNSHGIRNVQENTTQTPIALNMENAHSKETQNNKNSNLSSCYCHFDINNNNHSKCAKKIEHVVHHTWLLHNYHSSLSKVKRIKM